MDNMAPSITDTPATALEHRSASGGVRSLAQRAAGAKHASWVRTIAWKLTLLISFLLALEITARSDEWIRYGTPLFTRMISDEYLRDADGIHGRPHARYKRWVMNSLGMQGPEVSLAKPAGTLRIVTIGASETQGFKESLGLEYPRRLEQRLNAVLGGNGCDDAGPRRIEVLNAALAGMSLPTQTRDVLTRLKRLDVDVVVVYPTPVQYLTPSPPQAASSRPAPAGELPFTNALHPRVWPRLLGQVKLLLPNFAKQWYWQRHVKNLASAHAADWRFLVPPQDRLAMFERDLRTLVAAIRSIGAVPVLGTHANLFMRSGPHDRNRLVQWEYFYARATGPTIVAFDSAGRLATIRVAEETGVTLVDIAPLLSTAKGDVFVDAVHFTDRGAAIVADAFATGVLSVLPQGACVRNDVAALPRRSER
jgi:hypothetical protein